MPPSIIYTSNARMYEDVGPLPKSPAETSKCNLDAKAFFMLTDHSTSENST